MCKFLAYFSIKEILFKSIFGKKFAGILLQVFVATCNKVRGLTHFRGESGGYIVIEWGIQAKSNTNVNTSINTDYRYLNTRRNTSTI